MVVKDERCSCFFILSGVVKCSNGGWQLNFGSVFNANFKEY